MEKIRLLISVPSARDWKPQFGASLCGLVQHLSAEKLGGRLEVVEMAAHFQASCLSTARERSLLYAEKEGFTHWLSLDDDMVFPVDSVDKLLVHNVPVAVANYRRKQEEVLGICLDLDGQFINSSGKTGLQEVGWIGGGLNLFDINAVKVVEPPRFSVLWVKEKQAYMSEDYYFSTKLREQGIKMFCDHDLSQQVQHIGDVAYRF